MNEIEEKFKYKYFHAFRQYQKVFDAIKNIRYTNMYSFKTNESYTNNVEIRHRDKGIFSWIRLD